MYIVQSAILEKNSCTDYCTTDKTRDSESSEREGDKMEEGWGERGNISSLVSNSHREHLLRPSSAILILNIDNNPENNGISQGTCFPRLLQPNRFFQSSATSNSWRMLCVMSKQFSRKFKTMTAQEMQYLSPKIFFLLVNLSGSSIL